MKVLGLSVSCVYLILFLYFSINSGNFKKSVINCVVSGVILLVMFHISGSFLGFIVPLNIYTLIFSALTGAPGVVFISLTGFLFA